MERVPARIAYLFFYALFILTGHPTAVLARVYHSLHAASNRYALVVLLQVPVFFCWCFFRPASLASFFVCERLAPLALARG